MTTGRLNRSLTLGGRVVRRIAFDSCSVSRLADCGERELVARRMRTVNARLVLPLDVAVEVLATPNASRRRVLLATLKLLGSALDGAPFGAQVLTDPIVAASTTDRFRNATREVRDLIRTGSLSHEAQAHIDALRAPQRRRERATNREAFDRFRARFDPTQLVQSLAEVASAAGRDRSLLRMYRDEILEMAGKAGTRASRGKFRVLRDPVHLWWGTGWLYLAFAASTAPSKGAQRELPGHNDLGLLALMPFCDAFVTDDGGLLQAAIAVRGMIDSPKPWIGGFEDLRIALLGQGRAAP